MTFLKANKISYLNIEKDFGFYSFLFVIISLFTGPLLPEIGIILVIIYFFFNLKKINLKKNEKIVFFIFFGFYISINISNLFIKEEILQSYKVSFFYVRFFVYIILIKYLYNFNFFKFNKTLIFVATYIFIIFDSIFQFYTGSNFFGMEKQGFKISGIFGDEQILGSYIIKLLPLTLFFIYKCSIKEIQKKIFLLFTIFISIIGIVISNEFNSILMLSVFLFFIIPILIKHNFKTFLTISFILIIFSQISDFSSQKNRAVGVYNNIYSGNGTIIASYSSLIKTSYLIWKDNKIFGSGIKSYENLSKNKKYQTSIFSENYHPHNYYFQTLCETGLIGLSFLILLLILAIKNFIISFKKIFRNFNFEDNYNISKFLISIGIIINIFPFIPSGNFFNNWLSIIIFTYIGLLIGIIFSKTKKTI